MYAELNMEPRHVKPCRKLDFEHPANGSYIQNKHVEKVGHVVGNPR